MSGEQGVIQGEFFFDPEDLIYKDHFPGNPVVPGTLMIHAFTKAVALHFPTFKIESVTNFRFKHFLTPDRYQYKITDRDTEMVCELFADSKKVMTGKFTSNK